MVSRAAPPSSSGAVEGGASVDGEVASADGAVAGADAEVAGAGAEVAGAGAEVAGADAGIVVDVAGAVRRPGVYRMSPGARVHEAIQAAGGARRGAALGALNRAAVLVDGQQVMVGAAADEARGGDGPGIAGASAGAGGATGPGGTININSADVAGLDALPGIGPVTAERIVASCEATGPFATLDDLDRVPGIGPTTIESLRAVATT